MSLLVHAFNKAVIVLCRPYIIRELPGWGKIYDLFVGDYKADKRWRAVGKRWSRGKLHGYEMLLDLGSWSNRSAFFLGRYYDLPTQLLLKLILNEGDTFVDIGGNEGMISLLASRLVGPTGRVISFEPNPKPREVFAKVIERNKIVNVVIHSFGLGENEAMLTMAVPKANTGEGCFGQLEYPSDSVDKVDCFVRRGDDVLKTEVPNLIKVDVEGFELFVMRGLSQTLERVKPPIVMEVMEQALSHTGTQLGQLVEFMRAAGYESYRLGMAKRAGAVILKLSKEKIEQNTREGDFLWAHKAKHIERQKHAQRWPVNPFSVGL